MTDDVSARSPAVTVHCLIAMTGLVFLYEVWLGSSGSASDAQGRFIAAWGLVPREFLREITSPGATSQVVWLTPLTAMFIHGGPIHLLGNWLFLWMFGGPIEARLGHVRFAVFYLICGLAAASIHVASDSSSYLPSVGASGAISGVLGAYVVCHPRHRLRLLWLRVRVPAFSVGLLWIVIQVISGLYDRAAQEGGVAWTAHVGGFAVGIALIRSMPERQPGRSALRI